MRFNSVKFELSFIYTLILGIILIIFSAVVYMILSSTLYKELDQELALKAEEVASSISTYLDVKGSDPQFLKEALEKTIGQKGQQRDRWWIVGFEKRWLKRLDDMDLAGMYINFANKDNESLITSPNMDSEVLEVFQRNMAFPAGTDDLFRNIDFRDRHLRLINYPYQYKGETDYLIQIAASPQPIALMLRDWLNAMILSIPVILVLTSFVGRLFAERILRPVDEITSLAHQITLEDLTTRMATKNYPIEMESLINSFNEMIDRMQTSFTHIEEFSSLAAHELKTPLTIIRGESELALMGQRTVEEYRRALKVNLEESEQMLRTIDDLLFLTKLDYQPEIFQFSNVNLTEFLGEVYDQAKILAEKYKVDIRFVPAKKPAIVRADKVHLRRLFFNLIDNASKFTSAEGGIITIRMDLAPKKVFVHVIDNGCGIAPENLPKIFNRFYREQHKRVGNGLGLNIALSIAKIHQGEIKVVSEQGRGSTFTVMLPLISG